MVPNSWLHRCNWCIINNYTQLNKSTVLIPSLTYVATWIALKESLVFWALAIASSCYLASRPVSSLASWLHMLTSPHTHTYLHTMPQWKTLLHVHMMMIKQITSDRFVPKHTYTHIAPTRSTLIPKSHSCLHRKVEFVSFTKPFKISSPMTAYGWKTIHVWAISIHRHMSQCWQRINQSIQKGLYLACGRSPWIITSM